MADDREDALQRGRIDPMTVDGAWAVLIEAIPGDGHLSAVDVALAPAFQGCGLGRTPPRGAPGAASGR